jgi:hypothetical protein
MKGMDMMPAHHVFLALNGWDGLCFLNILWFQNVQIMAFTIKDSDIYHLKYGKT